MCHAVHFQILLVSHSKRGTLNSIPYNIPVRKEKQQMMFLKPPSATLPISLIAAVLSMTSGCGNRAVQPEAPAPMPIQKAEQRPSVTTPHLANFVASTKDFYLSPKPQKRVALTFDAGSDDKAVKLILEELAKHKVHATFFLTGKFCEKFPEAVKEIADAGMEIGNHSYSHPQFTKLTDEEIREQLSRAEEAIHKSTGKSAKPLFRFPYGARDKRSATVVAEEGYQSIYWYVDSLDSVGKPKTAEFIAERVIEKLVEGGVSLMHVSSIPSAEALPRIFEHLEKEGLTVVPVSELLGDWQVAEREKQEKRLAREEAKRRSAK